MRVSEWLEFYRPFFQEDRFSGEGRSREYTKQFFNRFASHEDRALIRLGFFDLEQRPLSLGAVIDALYDIRCDVVHEGNYWSFSFKTGHYGMLSGEYDLIAQISLHDFRSVVGVGDTRGQSGAWVPGWCPDQLPSARSHLGHWFQPSPQHAGAARRGTPPRSPGGAPPRDDHTPVRSCPSKGNRDHLTAKSNTLTTLATVTTSLATVTTSLILFFSSPNGCGTCLP